MKYTMKQLDNLNLPNSTIRYLLNEGLPENMDKENIMFSFDTEPKQFDSKKELVKIGNENNSGDPLCISQFSGAVILINEDESVEEFINSDISCLVKCLFEFDKIRKKRLDIAGGHKLLDENINKKLVGKFEEKVYEIDSALIKAEHFWPIIIEQMEHQMM